MYLMVLNFTMMLMYYIKLHVLKYAYTYLCTYVYIDNIPSVCLSLVFQPPYKYHENNNNSNH